MGSQRAIATFPDLDSARHFWPAEGERNLAVMPPLDILGIARAAGLVLVIKVPRKEGPVSVVVNPRDIDAVATPLNAPEPPHR